MTRDDDHDEALELDALPDRFGDDARVCSCAECTEWRARYMPVPTIPGPGAHWRGWTARVGLRKSRLHFDAVRMRRTVRQDWAGDDGAFWRSVPYDQGGDLSPGLVVVTNTTDQPIEVAPGLTFTEREADRNAAQARREASLQAARRKVESLPPDHRRYLQGEFQRAEDEAAAIMRHGFKPRTPPPNPLIAATDYGTDDGGRPCCHTTGPLHHPACQERHTP
jgi:hypothetical protein